METNEITIRPFEARDKNSVRSICCDTAFMGENVTNFFEDREIFADFAISYYTDYEPESLFVVQSKEKVSGYIAGCCDTKRYAKIFESRILPKAILKCLTKGVLLKPKARNFILNTLKSFLKGEFNRPQVSEGYPAHLHINVDRRARGTGIGFMLMNFFLRRLKEKNIPAVHLCSISKTGQAFFSKFGFDILYSKKVSYFDYLLKEEQRLICFGKKL